MDASRFDDLSRALTSSPSRRALARLLSGLVLGTVTSASMAETEAKKKKKCPPCRKPRKGKCKAKLPDGTACGGPCKACQGGACVALADDTSCGECRTCQNGACQITPDDTACGECRTCQNGACQVTPDDTACGECRTCQSGVCETSPDDAACGGSCVHCQGGACVPKPDDTVCGGDRCQLCEAGDCVTQPNGTPCSPGHNCRIGVCPTCPAVTGGSNKAVGAACNADTPEECASGVCGCSFATCPCFCRNATCADTGQSCSGNLDCCVGLCSGSVCVA